jgi:hypothetical protein
VDYQENSDTYFLLRQVHQPVMTGNTIFRLRDPALPGNEKHLNEEIQNTKMELQDDDETLLTGIKNAKTTKHTLI